jgi:uncharacterized protein (DUF1501 family)
MTVQSSSRRKFIQSLGATACSPMALPLLGSLAAMREAVANPVGYKALVCVYLAGGNDSFNTVLSTDPIDVETYERVRPSLKLNSAELHGLGTTGLALHPQLGYLAEVFNGGHGKLNLAVVGSVGPLLAPSDRNTASYDKPDKLFSHNDQTSIWLTGELEGKGQGWGGGMVGATGANNSMAGVKFQSVSLNFASPFSSSLKNGAQVSNFVSNTSSGISRPIGNENSGSPQVMNQWPADTLLPQVLRLPSSGDWAAGTVVVRGNTFENAYANVLASAYRDWQYLRSPNASRLTLVEPEQSIPSQAGLMKQLHMVANFIKSNSSIGVGRQVFFVQLGGFDTHSGQPGVFGHDGKMEQLNTALKFFYDSLGPSYYDSVTTFTASEFGRKLLENGDGTDHGWGGHHFVMGGSVVSGKYGVFPTLAETTSAAAGDRFLSPHLEKDGTLVPQVSVDQFAWELAKWMGVPDTTQAKTTLFPRYFELAPGVPLSFMESSA